VQPGSGQAEALGDALDTRRELGLESGKQERDLPGTGEERARREPDVTAPAPRRAPGGDLAGQRELARVRGDDGEPARSPPGLTVRSREKLSVGGVQPLPEFPR
jgi:hypothetical protein